MTKLRGCFECGDPGHWRSNCPWVDKVCGMRGCGQKMKLLTSGREWSFGCRFLKCKCGAFKWVDEPPKQVEKDQDQASSSSPGASGGNLKLTLPGNNPMIVEGCVDDIAELMKRLKV